MPQQALACDYLVIGAGASAMAFVDTLLDESDASVVMVDERHRPGGHWNDAYPFVRLHQPSQWYGVASRELGDGARDAVGVNRGHYGLASGPQVLAYFDQVMQQRFLPSGRVRWLAKTRWEGCSDGTHTVRSLTSDDGTTIEVRRKTVDATHIGTQIPSSHRRGFAVADGVRCVPVSELPRVERPYTAYTVVGAGKTGMDACIWLLENGVAHERIRWIVPRDPWMMNRAQVQPGVENCEHSIGAILGQLDAIATAKDCADLFACLEAKELLLRLDPRVEPSAYRCAVVSTAELAELRRLGEIVRLGHVKSIERERIVLDDGSVDALADTLYVDCSAKGFAPTPKLPIFDGDRINLLAVRTCQPLFSAALIAWVESHVASDAEKNALCAVVPGPERPIDWLRMWAVNLRNMASWRSNPELGAWTMRCRLNAVAVYMRGIPQGDPRWALLQSVGAKAAAAAARLPALLAGA